MPMKNNFNEVFARLKSIIQPYAKKMDAAYDTETYYLLNTRYIMKNKQRFVLAECGAEKITSAFI